MKVTGYRIIITVMPKFLEFISNAFLELTETVVIGLSLFLVVYLFLTQPHQVNGQSMVPNFKSGEYVLTDKISYRFGDPERGDVIVFHAPESAHCPTGTGCDFIKRILALPGETVKVADNGIYVNGTKIDEAMYLPADYETEAGAFTQNRDIQLGSDEYFAVGDNRPYSSDSRAWGPIHKDDIIGRAFFKYWPADSVGLIPDVTY